ncbi:hypothetical protein FSP39_000994 [Pinctada imbricata]|uniref:Transglutaminase-like domain-containing protein n=1 Tax=Pinctada imbricata TaxID=66713 RepID=A0AA88XGR9_PINIB|nr:hypothetical protein FSP39_000994 [Pinctada imbricata]
MSRRRADNTTGGGSLPPKRGRYRLRPLRNRPYYGYGLNITNPVIDDEGRKNNLDTEDFLAETIVLKESKKYGKALNLIKIAVFGKSVQEHHTYDYKHPDIILRRGQPFTIEIEFDRVISKKDIATLEFAYGRTPLESKGTNNRLDIDLQNKKKTTNINGWGVEVLDVDETKVRCTVWTTADSSIGIYRLFTDTRISGNSKPEARVIKEYKNRKLILLFNAWEQDDTVYMEGEDKRQEYVKNDTGLIWGGNAWKHEGWAWNFGQFERPVLDVTLSLLEKVDTTNVAMSSPVQVTRLLSALANSSDEDGVLEGRWEDKWPKNCKLPWEWVSSVDILKEFDKTQKSVQFGQCWVFSGILTSMCRALGIPTRSVTNFESAHDYDQSMTIDTHIDDDGDPIEHLDDSIWNFHVWNECWFKRNDLPEGNDGWQLVDATPQEASEKIMRCGPAPLAAIKEGRVYLNYDVGFAFAEVNGDKIRWRRQEDGTLEVIGIDKNAIGKKISTKQVGSDEREDLTLQYKYPEGSKDERRVVESVNQFSGNTRKRNIYREYDTTPEFKIEVDTPEDTLIGNDFEIGIKVKNLTKKKASTKIRATVIYKLYTGVPGKRLTGFMSEDDIKANGSKEVSVAVSLKDYKQYINPDGSFKIFVTARNMETRKVKVYERIFSLRNPDILIEVIINQLFTKVYN